jgi:hypothetical protein
MVQIEKTIEVEDLINDPNFNTSDWAGYVYVTLHIPSGKQYIGKKSFFHSQNKKLGKKELAAIPITRGRRPSTKLIIKESDWKTYYGSAEEIKKYPSSELKRYVLKLCKTKKELTYWEVDMLFRYGVLFNNNFINDNILGTFYRRDFEKLK